MGAAARRCGRDPDLRLPFVRLGESLQRLIDRNQIDGGAAGDRQVRIEGDTVQSAAALLILLRSRKVHEHAAH